MLSWRVSLNLRFFWPICEPGIRPPARQESYATGAAPKRVASLLSPIIPSQLLPSPSDRRWALARSDLCTVCCVPSAVLALPRHHNLGDARGLTLCA
jgi:hypothetical protein